MAQANTKQKRKKYTQKSTGAIKLCVCAACHFNGSVICVSAYVHTLDMKLYGMKIFTTHIQTFTHTHTHASPKKYPNKKRNDLARKVTVALYIFFIFFFSVQSQISTTITKKSERNRAEAKPCNSIASIASRLFSHSYAIRKAITYSCTTHAISRIISALIILRGQKKGGADGIYFCFWLYVCLYCLDSLCCYMLYGVNVRMQFEEGRKGGGEWGWRGQRESAMGQMRKIVKTPLEFLSFGHSQSPSSCVHIIQTPSP